MVNAGGDITTSSITLGTMARVELLADNGSIIANMGSFGGFPLITADVLLMRQMGIFADSFFNATSSVVNRLELRITTAVAQPIHSWMRDIIRNGAGTSFSLAGEGVVLNSITLPAAADFGMTAIDLQATNITLGGDLTAGAVILRTNTITRPNANLVITATVGGITGTAFTAGGALPAFDSTVTTLTLIQNSPFGSSAPFTFGTTLTVMLQTAASQTVQGWMAAIGRDLNLTSTGGDITIGRNINVGTADLNLTASGNILPGNTLAVLTADTVNLELTGSDSSFGSGSRPFAAASGITTLNITTQANQQYRGWMAPPAGTNRNLNLNAGLGEIVINAAEINLGTGNLTLSGSNIVIGNTAGLTIRVGDFSPAGTFCSNISSILCGGDSNRLLVFADGNITLNSGFESSGGGVRLQIELRADADGDGMGMITSTPRSLEASSLILQQAGAFAADLFTTNSRVDGAVQLRITAAGVDQPIHEWMMNLGDGGFRLQGAGGVALNSITTTAALTRTGRIDLRATTINLGGALTGGAVALRTNTITGDSANLVAIHATTGEITATTITSIGRAGASTSRPALAAGVTSISLEQTSAFGGRSTLPFILVDANITAALTLSTRSEQLVRNWMIAPGRNLTITSSDRVVVEDPIGDGVNNRDIGAGALTLGSTGGGVVRIFADISTTGNLTLSSSGTGGINFNGGARILNGGTITLSGNARSNRALSLSSGSDEITLGSTLTLTGDSIMFGNAVITGTANASLTIITTSSALTLDNDITLSGTGILDLRSGQGAITGSATLTLSATTTVRLRQVDVFGGAAPFGLSGTGSLELTTTVNQDVLNWMIASGRNLTVTSARNVFVRSAIGALVVDRNLGTGNLTLISERRVRILEDIATTGNIILTGVASSTQPAIRFENGARVVMGGSVRLNGSAGVLTSGGSVTLNATATDGILTLTGSVNTRFIDADGATTFGDLILTGATIQIARVASAPVNTRIVLRGQNIMLTSANGIELGRFNRVGDFLRNNDVASLTVNAQGALTIAADITAADDTRSGGDIRLRGAATGTADLTITASGTLTIENDINIGANALTLRSGEGAIVNGGTRPTLTAGTVSLEQAAAFAEGRLFTFADAIGSLVFDTDAEQVVHNWMIREDTNLTVTSARNVRVEAAIGSGNRDLGAGNLTLESTGRVVRILAGISTTGGLTLIGGTGGINFNGGERTLSGATVTLSGNARSNRDLTITATSGLLTLNGDINTGTSALSLNGGGDDGIDLGGSLTLTGGSITLMDTVIGVENLTILTITADTLTLTRNITLSGDTSIIDLRSRQGAITGGVALRAPTVRLRQADEFGDAPPFDLSATFSLELTTTVNQDVQDWMIALDRNLTVTSARNVFVRSAIGALVVDRNLGAGSLTLRSERRVRILEDIATTGNIILTGVASSTQPAIRFENGARVVMGGSVRLNGSAGVLTSGSSVTLNATETSGILSLNGNVNTLFTAADGTTTFGDLILTGATIQIARVASAPVNTRILLRGQNITLTSAMGIQIGRFNRVGDFLRNNDVASLTVNAQSALTIAADITAADDTRSGGDIRLRGAATGTADLTITASGTLTIENDINIGANALTLISGAGAIIVATERSTLTASTVSFRQVAAFARRPFDFDGTVGSLEITTDAEQVVRDWMIAPGRNLSITSARNVRVEDAIGSGDRDLGAGNLTLRSTGRVVRILADISTTGDITLSGGTGGINFNGGARILNGAIITLTGAARSNRALTITATGVLTISNNINIGTSALTLTGASLTFGSSVDLTAGSHSFTPSLTCNTGTSPRCTDTTP